LINGNQLSLLHIKLFFLQDFPFVEAAAAQRIAFMYLRGFWPFKLNYVTHVFLHANQTATRAFVIKD
jgi:hypothetical protein